MSCSVKPGARRAGPPKARSWYSFEPSYQFHRFTARAEVPRGTRDPRIDAYLARSAEFARPILSHLREVVHAVCPQVEETLKWSSPHFTYHGMLCSMAAVAWIAEGKPRH